MKNYKAIVLGPQCSGKTMLKKYLRQNSTLSMVEEDELFTELNGGEYPQDMEYKENVLRPKLEERIRQTDNMIFLTSYCNPLLLQELKFKGYKVIQLELNIEEFRKRNERRMKEEGYENANIWAKDVFDFHREIKDKKLVDKEIDVSKPIEVIAKQVLDFLQA
jgi:hypothetical protein